MTCQCGALSGWEVIVDGRCRVEDGRFRQLISDSCRSGVGNQSTDRSDERQRDSQNHRPALLAKKYGAQRAPVSEPEHGHQDGEWKPVHGSSSADLTRDPGGMIWPIGDRLSIQELLPASSDWPRANISMAKNPSAVVTTVSVDV